MYDVSALLRRQSAHAIQELVVAVRVIEAHVTLASCRVLTRNSSSRWGFAVCRCEVRKMLFLLSVLVATAGVPQALPNEGLTRPCKMLVTEGKGTRKTPAQKKKSGTQEITQPVQGCLELRLSALDVQEYMQKFVREQSWPVGDELAAEEAWTFAMHLDAQKLRTYTKPYADLKMRWRGGKGLVQVRTTEQKDGYTQVVINARFDGYGESEDTFSMKRESWAMESNGTLEATLISALE